LRSCSQQLLTSVISPTGGQCIVISAIFESNACLKGELSATIPARTFTIAGGFAIVPRGRRERCCDAPREFADAVSDEHRGHADIGCDRGCDAGNCLRPLHHGARSRAISRAQAHIAERIDDLGPNPLGLPGMMFHIEMGSRDIDK